MYSWYVVFTPEIDFIFHSLTLSCSFCQCRQRPLATPNMSGSSPDPYRYGHPPPSHTDDHIHPYTHRHNHYHHNFSPLALQEFAGFAPIQDDPLLYQDFNNAVDDSFNAAFVSSHTLPSLDYNFGFLDNMPGPAESDSLPFGYITHEGPSRERARSPIVSIPINAMSSSRHTYERRPRLPNGFDNLVDLTSDPQEELPPISRPKRQSPTPGPSQKRLKHNDGTSISVPDREVDEKIEAIDLSGDQQAVQNVLQKQREDAIKSQQRPEEQATTFNTFTCVICMDLPTDLTATSCGTFFYYSHMPRLIKGCRPPLLPHLPYGSSHCRRKPLRPWRTQALAMPRLQESY
jgi:hypothetical protein